MYLRTPLKWLILFGLLQMTICQKKGIFSSECVIDEDCDAPALICHENKCRNKDLFPARSQDIIGSILIVVASAFGIMVGIGGGGIVGPIGYIYMNMSYVETNALSNSVALIIAIAKLVNSLATRHPENKRKVLIDYDVVYILGPFILIGNLISSLITPTLPELLILINFVGLMAFSFYAGVGNYRINRAKELKAAEHKRHNEEENKKRLTSPGEVPLRASTSGEIPLPGKELELDDIPVEFGQGEEPSDKLHLKKIPMPSSTRQTLDVLQGKDEEIAKKEISAFNPPETNPKADSQTKSGELRTEKIQKKVFTEEKKNCSPKKLAQVGLLFIFVNVVTVLRAGSGSKSIVGIVRCSSWFWVLISFYVLGCLAFSYFGFAKWKRMRTRKIKGKISCHTDSRWPEQGLGMAIVKAIFIEFLSSISGIGGTGITVFLMGLNLNVKSAVATSLYLVFVSRFILTFLNYLMGTLRIDYFFFVGGICLVVCFIADKANDLLQRKLNKLSVMNLIFMCMCLASGLVYGIGGSIKLHDKVSNGTPLFKFASFC